MIIERTIFDEMLENLEAKIRRLQQEIAKLRAENDELAKEIEATNKSKDNLPWNEKAEARDEIRYYEGKIRANDTKITMCQDQIQKLNKDIQEVMNTRNPGKTAGR